MSLEGGRERSRGGREGREGRRGGRQIGEQPCWGGREGGREGRRGEMTVIHIIGTTIFK